MTRTLTVPKDAAEALQRMAKALLVLDTLFPGTVRLDSLSPEGVLLRIDYVFPRVYNELLCPQLAKTGGVFEVWTNLGGDEDYTLSLRLLSATALGVSIPTLTVALGDYVKEGRNQDLVGAAQTIQTFANILEEMKKL